MVRSRIEWKGCLHANLAHRSRYCDPKVIISRTPGRRGSHLADYCGTLISHDSQHRRTTVANKNSVSSIKYLQTRLVCSLPRHGRAVSGIFRSGAAVGCGGVAAVHVAQNRRDSCIVISGCRGADQVSGRPVSAGQERSG